MENEQETAPDNITFGEYARLWQLAREKAGQVEGGTLKNGRRDVKIWNRLFRDTPLRDIRPQDIRNAIVAMHTGELTGRKLSGTYMNHLFIALKQILDQAVIDDLIDVNPCTKVRAPKCDTARRKAMSTQEMDACFAAVTHDLTCDFQIAVAIMLDCGLRSEEAMALGPTDVDTARCALHVRGAVKDYNNSVGRPKSAKSERDVPMTDRLVRVCRRWERIRERYGISASPFCCSLNGERRTLNAFRIWWKKHKAEYGAEDYTLHQLRHSYMTRMARYVTSPFTLQHLAGWSNVKPAEVYVHTDYKAMEEAVAASQQRMAQPREPGITSNEGYQYQDQVPQNETEGHRRPIPLHVLDRQNEFREKR